MLPEQLRQLANVIDAGHLPADDISVHVTGNEADVVVFTDGLGVMQWYARHGITVAYDHGEPVQTVGQLAYRIHFTVCAPIDELAAAGADDAHTPAPAAVSNVDEPEKRP